MNQKQFYKSQAWRKCRAAFISYRQAIDGGVCQLCGERMGFIVHHCNVWLNDDNCNDPNIALNFDNLQYVCLDCHNKERDPNAKPKQAASGRYFIDADGNILAPIKK